MRPLFFLTLFFFLPLFLAGAATRHPPSGPTPSPSRSLLDPLGRSYHLLPDARLVTGNPLKNQSYSFFDSSLGTPSLVDVMNPFEIIVYYQDYARIILLDRTLSELQRIDLNIYDDLQQAGAVAHGLRNDIWIFDDWDFKLKVIVPGQGLRSVTNDLRLQLGIAVPPSAILVDGTTVGLLFRDAGRLAIFENTGRFLREVELPAATYTGWSAPYLLGTDEAGAAPWGFRMSDRAPRFLTASPSLAAGNFPLLRKDGLYVPDSATSVRREPLPELLGESSKN